ncbi:MAG: tyrosine-type recombinase/integrase, partial [Paracoccus sp. (in: a-proteobacteria)]|uniref:tyrosine-type recombinase/integrase n=1 Tax=Paracoccus sp. TaxID=267 RepID=UPI0039E65929
RGTPANTLRAWESDLGYIVAWRQARFGAGPGWPEREEVALAFVLDHSRDLAEAAEDDPARLAAESLIGAGLRRGLACPAPSTLDRRIASWRAFHRMRNLASPFEAPILRQARQKARKAADRIPAPKSAHPVTRDVLRQLLDVSGPGLRGLRDRALLCLGWASGGRRRSEIVALDVEDLDLTDLAAKGLIRLRLPGTKTTTRGDTPRLVLQGTPAHAVTAWIDAAGLTTGPLFRRITRHDTIGRNRLSAAGVSEILRRLLRDAGLPAGFASPHGLRSGFLTQAARDGAPLQAAMKLSLHRSPQQAQKYYADVEIAENPAASQFDAG